MYSVGFHCPLGAVVPDSQCNSGRSTQFYCPNAVRVPVPNGYAAFMTEPRIFGKSGSYWGGLIPTSIFPCPAGAMCTNGSVLRCPAGRFSFEGSATCSPCSHGTLCSCSLRQIHRDGSLRWVESPIDLAVGKEAPELQHILEGHLGGCSFASFDEVLRGSTTNLRRTVSTTLIKQNDEPASCIVSSSIHHWIGGRRYVSADSIHQTQCPRLALSAFERLIESKVPGLCPFKPGAFNFLPNLNKVCPAGTASPISVSKFGQYAVTASGAVFTPAMAAAIEVALDKLVANPSAFAAFDLPAAVRTCEPGYMCMNGERMECPPGTFQALSGESACEEVPDGFFSSTGRCTGKSGLRPYQNCGGPDRFCPPKSAQPKLVRQGYYSTPVGEDNKDTRSGEAACETLSDRFCVNGERQPVPAGHEAHLPYATRPCPAGVWCNSGRRNPCRPGVLCPAGTSSHPEVTGTQPSDCSVVGRYCSDGLVREIVSGRSLVQVNRTDFTPPWRVGSAPCACQRLVTTEKFKSLEVPDKNQPTNVAYLNDSSIEAALCHPQRVATWYREPAVVCSAIISADRIPQTITPVRA